MTLVNKLSAFLVLFVSILSFTSCSVGVVTPVAVVSRPAPVTITYVNPDWAPPIYQGARYYYMPDIETYYDLSNRSFVYLNNGQWLFSPTLPEIYAGYDLYNGFAVTLNANVFEPWQHHHFYVSNYPRYYYQNVYVGADYRYVRGFNENERKPVFYREEERARVDAAREHQRFEQQKRVEYDVHRNDRPVEPSHLNNSTNNNRNDNNNAANNRSNTTIIINNNNSGTNSNSNANTNRVAPPAQQPQHVDRAPNGSGYTRPPQATNYYGKNIGQPVKVTPNMKTKPAPQQIKPANNERSRKSDRG